MRDPRLTEQRDARTPTIGELDSLGIVDLMNAEDRTVADAMDAMGEQREYVVRAPELAEAAFRAGGRLIYVGGSTSGRLGRREPDG